MKIIIKRFARTLEDDIRDYKGFREEFSDSKFRKKSDQWLINRARRYYDDYSDSEKENIKKNRKKLIASTTAVGALIGALKKGGTLKNTSIGAAAGLGVGSLLDIIARKHHSNEARKAREELKRRGLL